LLKTFGKAYYHQNEFDQGFFYHHLIEYTFSYMFIPFDPLFKILAATFSLVLLLVAMLMLLLLLLLLLCCTLMLLFTRPWSHHSERHAPQILK
jgi:hypothetical protein